MNISDTKKKPSPSDDLTIVLLRGNGSPRSFRLSLSSLHRSLTALGFLFAFAILASIVLIGLSIVRSADVPSNPVAPIVAVAPPVVVVETPAPSVAPVALTPPAPVAETGSPPHGGLWQSLRGAVQPTSSAPSSSDPELKKEVDGLRQDNARLNSQADGRKDLTPNAGSPLLQFFGPHSVLLTEAQTMMRIKNPRVTRDTAGKQMIINFELHNTDPQQRQERGYIVAIAKASDLLLTYPSNVFAPNQNILLDFTKGETFAVSRFREARATFPLNMLDNRKASYQVILFGTDGRVLGTLHVEEKR